MAEVIDHGIQGNVDVLYDKLGASDYYTLRPTLILSACYAWPQASLDECLL